MERAHINLEWVDENILLQFLNVTKHDRVRIDQFTEKESPVLPRLPFSSFPSQELSLSGTVGIISDSLQNHPKKREYYTTAKNAPLTLKTGI